MAVCSTRTAPMFSSEATSGKFSQYSSAYAHHTSSSSSGVSTGTSSASSTSTSSNSYAVQHSQPNAAVPHSHAPHASSSQTHSPASQSGTQPNSDLDKPIGYGAFGVVWAVTDPRDGKRVALKKLPNAFHNMTAARRVYRELMMLCTLKHDNLVCANDILQPAAYETFSEIYVLTELMQTDLHRIIVSPQPLSADHVKVFLYQLLRGAKFLHSARIIHRDIKPGNLLVNSNCLLKICDFGLARVEEPDSRRRLTQEVVTQYYRAPELLMGTTYYTNSVDMWSIGCIFAELLTRKILFQSPSPLTQLELILETLGTPAPSEVSRFVHSSARHFVLDKQPPRRRDVAAHFSALNTQCTSEAVALLVRMLQFDSDRRISATEALASRYITDGRARYHACMCTCCSPLPGGNRLYATELEPTCKQPFTSKFEEGLTNVQAVKGKLYRFVLDFVSKNRVPLCLNPGSATFKQFMQSSAAQPNELPPSPHKW